MVVLEISGQSCKGSISAASTIVGKMSTNSTLNMHALHGRADGDDCIDESDDGGDYEDFDTSCSTWMPASVRPGM